MSTNDYRDMGERIRQRRLALGLTQSDVANEIGVATSTIQRYEKGVFGKIKLPVIEAVASVLQVNPSWLIGTNDDPTPTKAPSIFDIPGVQPLPKTYQVPLLGQIACGDPILAEQNIADIVTVPETVKGADFALTCKGDSMINARIFDGDLVYIHLQETVENGEIAAVLIGEEATLKKVYQVPGRITLRPCNPMYPDMEYSGEELRTIRILGKAIAFTSKVRT